MTEPTDSTPTHAGVTTVGGTSTGPAAPSSGTRPFTAPGSADAATADPGVAAAPSTAPVPRGWYPDPQDATRLRKWDGRAWTDSWMHRGDGSAVAVSAAAVGYGWFTDPWDATRSRLWDGNRWTDHVRVGRTVVGRPALGPGFFALARVVQVLLGLTGLVAAVVGGGSVWAYAVLGRWAADSTLVSAAEGERVDAVTGTGAVLELGCTVVTGVVFVVWLFRAYGSDRVDPQVLRRGRGWTIAGWLVPVVSFWIPRQTVADLWRGARGVRDGSRTVPGRWRLEVWWVAWVVQIVLSQISFRMAQQTDLMGTDEAIRFLRDAVGLDVVASVATVVAAVFAVVVVEGVTRALDRPESVDPPPATA